MILERITKKEVLRVLRTGGRRSFYELIKLIRHRTERHEIRMYNTLGTLRNNGYLVEETVQTGMHEDPETKVKTPIMTHYYWDKELFQKCRGTNAA